MGHIVTATLIVAKTGNTEQYFEKGAILPQGVSATERKRLVAVGLVKYEKDAPATTQAANADAEKAAAEKAAAEAKAAEAEAAKKAAADKAAETGK